MLKSLERYFDEKNMTLNATKSKIMVFAKKERRKQVRGWEWKNEEIEKVRDFEYLGNTFKKNNSDESHIKEVVTRAAEAMAQIWGKSVSKFGGDFDKRLLMFNVMV